MRLLLSLSIIPIFILLVYCGGGDESFPSCNVAAIVSDSEFDSAPQSDLVINSLEIIGNCLTISISASGCDGDSWEVNLFGSEATLRSLPPQRTMLLSLNNQELCEAVITRSFTFDVTTTQDGLGSIWLNFLKSEERILYNYD